MAAAVPDYLRNLGVQFAATSPPGHRFLLYYSAWEANWEKNNTQLPACKEAASNINQWAPLMQALLQRQEMAIQSLAETDYYEISASSVAPFTTGLGNEHPLENGFAFFNPYGLPYLPGSGVKGVMRRSACELASGEWGDNTHGWSKEAISILFGSEDAENPERGVLTFWDIIPQIKGSDLMVEIMTPHQSHYYQGVDAAGSHTPHDSGSPNPICFLTVPPGSGFTFRVVCDAKRLALITKNGLQQAMDWKAMLATAFEHAFTWCGFGAKTAVGYGAMKTDVDAQIARDEAKKQAIIEIEKNAEAMRVANLTPEEQKIEGYRQEIKSFQSEFDEARKTDFNPGGTFNQARAKFADEALKWDDSECRKTAGELIRSSMTRDWGRPNKAESRKKLQDIVINLGVNLES